MPALVPVPGVGLPPEVPSTPETQTPVDWRAAFRGLALLSSTGLVTTKQVSRWVEQLNEHVDPRAGEELARIFNQTRSGWMQEFMG